MCRRKMPGLEKGLAGWRGVVWLRGMADRAWGLGVEEGAAKS